MPINMYPISTIVIAFNAEKTIERCLKSLSFADEIIVIDSYSSDSTPDLARQHTQHVFRRQWEGYVSQKEFAISKASHKWILWIDSDEELSPQLQKELVNAQNDSYAAYELIRKVQYMGKWINHCGWYPDPVVRLFNREKAKFDGNVVHEKLIVDGTIKRLRGDLYHYPYKDISHHLDKINHFSTLGAEQMLKDSKRCGYGGLLFRPLWKTVRILIFKAGFLDGIHGLVIALMAGYYTFLKYAKLWHLQKETNPGPTA